MNWKIAMAGVFLAIILWLGYVAYAVLTIQPSIQAQWGYVDQNTTEIWITAHLDKPLLVPASVENTSLDFLGIPVASVEKFDYGATKRDITLAIAIDNRNLVDALVRYMDNGQKGYVVFHLRGKLFGVVPIDENVTTQISEDILQYLNITAESRDVGIAKTPALIETTTDWAGTRGDNAVIINHLKLYNPNPFPLPISGVGYTIYANDIKIGQGTIVKSVVLPARGYGTVDVETLIDIKVLPRVWAEHIKNGEVSRVRAEIYLDITVLNMNYKMELATVDETIQTDIMGELNNMLQNLIK